jgi:hypothetical protein
VLFRSRKVLAAPAKLRALDTAPGTPDLWLIREVYPFEWVL